MENGGLPGIAGQAAPPGDHPSNTEGRGPVKIVIVTSCIEPGRDGIGDYSLHLAAECVRQGHACAIFAYRDRHVSQVTTVGGAVPSRRLPAGPRPAKVVEEVRRFIQEERPDAVSFQVAPYTLHPRGLVREWVDLWPRAFQGILLQVMIHETWIGASMRAPLKDRLVGLLQRHWITSMLKRLDPLVTHTSNPAYAALLKQQGISAEVLPLFGGIPVQDANGDDWLLPLLSSQGAKINAANRSEHWLFGIFGTLHPVWPPEPLIGMILAAAHKAGRKPLLLSLGRIGAGETLWKEISAKYSQSLPCHLIGPLDNLKMSQAFNSLDFGIATTPWGIIGKSSAATSMYEHGLPVIVNRDDAVFRGVPRATGGHSPLLHLLDHGLMDRLSELGKGERGSQLAKVASEFFSSFGATSKSGNGRERSPESLMN